MEQLRVWVVGDKQDRLLAPLIQSSRSYVTVIYVKVKPISGLSTPTPLSPKELEAAQHLLSGSKLSSTTQCAYLVSGLCTSLENSLLGWKVGIYSRAQHMLTHALHYIALINHIQSVVPDLEDILDCFVPIKIVVLLAKDNVYGVSPHMIL
ncbi:hypothetical protein TSUD_206820 [Trifolium subterraneum]|uniref:Uncharacterized protein n=1 Tax=Trifolium subterraneum TaxID=3900 RepID=A0A2Z6N0C6_TRISU|nr:hypothetical protein TSUD_206820 [Trifolium subterraneum]